jgi:aminopeptidase N
MPPREWAEWALHEAPKEKNARVLTDLLSLLASDDVHERTAIRYLPDASRAEFEARVETLTRKGFLSAPKGSDLKRVWFAAWIRSARSETARGQIEGLLDRKGALDIDQRWAAIEALARMGADEVQTRIAEELEGDPTDRGRRNAIQAEASIPNPQTQEAWLNRLTQADTEHHTPGQLRAAMAGLMTVDPKTIDRLADRYFEKLPELAAHGDEDFAEDFARQLYPSTCSDATLQRTDKLLSSADFPAAVLRRLRDLREEENRCQRLRAVNVSGQVAPGSGPNP